jgi:hypothetical protein
MQQRVVFTLRASSSRLSRCLIIVDPAHRFLRNLLRDERITLAGVMQCSSIGEAGEEGGGLTEFSNDESAVLSFD